MNSILVINIMIESIIKDHNGHSGKNKMSIFTHDFSAQEPKEDVRRPSVPRPSLTFHIFDFFSKTAEQILTKLDRKQVLKVLYQECVFRADWKSKMASDWLKHFSTFLRNR